MGWACLVCPCAHAYCSSHQPHSDRVCSGKTLCVRRLVCAHYASASLPCAMGSNQLDGCGRRGWERLAVPRHCLRREEPLCGWSSNDRGFDARRRLCYLDWQRVDCSSCRIARWRVGCEPHGE